MIFVNLLTFEMEFFGNLHLPHPQSIFHFESHVKNKWKCTCIVRDVSKAQSWRAVLAICRVIACQSQTSSLEYGQISYEGSSEVLRPSWWDWVVSGSRLLVPILPLHLPEDLLTFAFKDYFLFLNFRLWNICHVCISPKDSEATRISWQCPRENW